MYPVTLASDFCPDRSRLTTFFRYFMVIPVAIVFFFYALVGFFTIVAAWVMLSLTGHYPPGLYAFNAKLVRFQARLNSYFYLLTDEYPPFNGDADRAYPVHVEIGEPKPEYSRLKAFLRLIFRIPVFVLFYLYSMLLGVVVIGSWLMIVITGKQLPALQGLTESSMNYLTRAHAYMVLLTEDYPPITLDAEPSLGAGHAPATLPT